MLFFKLLLIPPVRKLAIKRDTFYFLSQTRSINLKIPIDSSQIDQFVFTLKVTKSFKNSNV